MIIVIITAKTCMNVYSNNKSYEQFYLICRQKRYGARR